MDFQYLLDIILRRKWLVVLAGLIPAIATFAYFSMQDRSYKSDIQISTGIIGRAGLNLEDNRGYLQDLLVNMNFSTLLEKMKGSNMKRLLAYEMLLHDLSGKKTPFRTIEKDEKFQYTNADIQALLREIKPRLDTLNTRVLPIESERVFKDVSKALEYDFKSLGDEIMAYRKGDTEAIAAEYQSEDAYLSAYLMNQLADIYIRLNRFEQEKKYIKEFDFNQKIASEKRYQFDEAKRALNLYKSDRTVIDLEVQSQGVVERIEDLEASLEAEKATIATAESNIAKINGDIRRFQESSKQKDATEFIDHDDMVKLRKQQKDFFDQYLATKDIKYKELADLEQRKMDLFIEREVRRESNTEDETYLADLNKKLEELRIDWGLKKNAAEKQRDRIVKELGTLQNRRKGLVGDQASVDQLQTALDLAKEEYEEAKNSLNIARTRLKKSYQPLQIIEYAQVADKPESSGRVMFTVFSGVLGGGFCTALLLLLAFMDMSLNNPHQFTKFTDLDLIGTINEIKKSDVDLNGIFNSNGHNPDLLSFKESIRNIRYSMEQSDANTFLFTSTQEKTGKTFLMITLAYALTLKQKKVLLIDTNFKNNTLTQMSEKAQRKGLLTTKLIGKNKLEESFESKSVIGDKFSVDHVDIIGNRGGYNSPGEIFAGKDFKQFITDLSQNYDYVFLEGASLNKYADTKELIEFADKVVAVFSAESLVNDSDKKSIQFLKQLDGKLHGAILNKLDAASLS